MAVESRMDTEIYFELIPSMDKTQPVLRMTSTTSLPWIERVHSQHFVSLEEKEYACVGWGIEQGLRRHAEDVSKRHFSSRSHFYFIHHLTMPFYTSIMELLPCRVKVRNGHIIDIGGIESIYYESPADKAQKKLEKKMRKAVPGLNAILGQVPCGCTDRGEKTLLSNIIHLNDFHEWDRKRVGTYLAKLHDDGVVNLEFKIPDKKETTT